MTPFYKKALALFTRTQDAQIQKGLAKYPEPFNPHNWTPEEMLNHALEETVDLTHYLVGLKELLDDKDKEITRLKTLLAKVPADVLQKAYDKAQAYDMNFNPHFDQDDQ
jgi:replication initiation and membrane attachment protein DnaB